MFERIIEKLYFRIDNNLATYDQLTGLYNYNWFEKIGREKFNDKKVYITIIDLNNFKSINDNYGHVFANDMLKNVGVQLKRIYDTDNNAAVIRYGGDEFLIISEKYDFGKRILLNYDCYNSLISIGSYTKNKEESIDYAIEKADQRMYNYKNICKKEKAKV